QQIRIRAKQNRKKIVLPRSSDPRVIKAAEHLTENELCEVILLKNEGSHSAPENLALIDPKNSPKKSDYAHILYERRKHKGMTEEQAEKLIEDPLYFASAMVAAGDADGCVAGSVSTTGDVLRAAIQTIGLKKGSNVVSSTFLMSFEDGRNYTYGD